MASGVFPLAPAAISAQTRASICNFLWEIQVVGAKKWLRMAAIRSWLELLSLWELSEASWLWFPPSSFAWRSFTWWWDAKMLGETGSPSIILIKGNMYIYMYMYVCIYIYKYIYITHTCIMYIYIHLRIYIYRNYNPPHIVFSNRFKGSIFHCPCCCISCLDFAAWIYWCIFWHDGTPTCKSDWCWGRGAEWEMKITKHELYILKNMYILYIQLVWLEQIWYNWYTLSIQRIWFLSLR